MNFEFSLKTKTIIGQNSIEKIVPFLEENQFNHVGVIIDQALKENSFIVSFVADIQKTNKLEVLWYYDLPFEPDYRSLDRVKLLFKEGNTSKVDAIIAIGGGSVMDFGKGIATLVVNHEPALTYRGFPKNLVPSIPVIAVPTTAGTASEVTFNAVFTDTDSGKKLGINTHNNFPALAILDSNMTMNCPFNVALSSGLDALVHTFESFACKNSNLYTRLFAKEAFALLYHNIENALKDSNDSQARENMLFGAYLAGISLFNAGSGPAGALSYPMGVVCKIPHGIAGGFILPYLIEFNLQNGYTEYADLYNSAFGDLGEDVPKTNKEKAAEVGSKMFELYEKLNVWDQVSKYPIDISNKQLNDYIDVLQGAFDQNPIKITTDDGKVFLKKIFKKNNN